MATSAQSFRRSLEAVLEKLADDVSQEKSLISEAVSENLNSEQSAAAHEAYLRNWVTILEDQRKELAEQHASNTELQKARTGRQNQLTQDLANAVSVVDDLKRQKESLTKKVMLNVEEQKNISNQLVGETSKKDQLEKADVRKATLLEKAVAKKTVVTQALDEAEQRLRWTSKETQAKEHLVNTQAKALVSLQAALVKFKTSVEDAKREKLDKLKLAHEKEAAMEALQRRSLELKAEDEEAREKEKEQLNREIQMVTMDSATLGTLEEAKKEEQRSLEAQVAEVQNKLHKLQDELSAKQEALQKERNSKTDADQQVATTEETIANLTSQKSEIGQARITALAHMQELSEHIQHLRRDEEQLRADTADIIENLRRNAAEEKTMKESLDRVRHEFGQTELVREKNKEKDTRAAQQLKELPNQIKETQLKQQTLRAERADMEAHEELTASQEKMVKEQLDLTRRDRQKLANAQFEVQRPLQQKERERQEVLDMMGGSPTEEATMRDLHAKVDAWNLEEVNAQKTVDTLKRLSEDRARKVEEIKKAFFEEQKKKEQFASARLAEAREAASAELDES